MKLPLAMISLLLGVCAEPVLAGGEDAPARPGQPRPVVEYSNAFQGVPGRGNLTSWNLAIPEAGLYQVRWEADLYSLPPAAALAGTCAVGDDPGQAFLYDAAAFSRQPGAAAAGVRYLQEHVDGTFVAHLGAGTTLAIHCMSSERSGGESEASPHRMYGASLLARRIE